MRWVDALKIWNGQRSGAWCVPRKGSPEHAEVKKIMEGEKSETKTGESVKAEEPKKEEPPRKKFKTNKQKLEEIKGRLDTATKREKVRKFLEKVLEARKAKKDDKEDLMKVLTKFLEHLPTLKLDPHTFKKDDDTVILPLTLFGGENKVAVNKLLGHRFTYESPHAHLPHYDITFDKVKKEIDIKIDYHHINYESDKKFHFSNIFKDLQLWHFKENKESKEVKEMKEKLKKLKNELSDLYTDERKGTVHQPPEQRWKIHRMYESKIEKKKADIETIMKEIKEAEGVEEAERVKEAKEVKTPKGVKDKKEELKELRKELSDLYRDKRESAANRRSGEKWKVERMYNPKIEKIKADIESIMEEIKKSS